MHNITSQVKLASTHFTSLHSKKSILETPAAARHSITSPVNLAFIVNEVSIVLGSQPLEHLKLLPDARLNSERGALLAQLLSGVCPHFSGGPTGTEGKKAKALVLQQVGKDGGFCTGTVTSAKPARLRLPPQTKAGTVLPSSSDVQQWHTAALTA